MKKLLIVSILGISFINADCGESHSLTPIEQARVAVNAFLKTASETEKKNLAEYLTFWRSEGGYQAVAPASNELRESLSPAAKKLFEDLKQFAEQFRVDANLPGQSRLSPEGVSYFEEVIELVK